MALESKNVPLALYYLRVGLGFLTLWSAWDVVVHQEQIYALMAGFPLIGPLAGQVMLLWFLFLLATGAALLVGWYYREASVATAAVMALSLLILAPLTPAVNAVIGPFRPLALKNLVWLGAALVLATHETDPYNPERRHAQGYPAMAGNAHLAFRILFGVYCVWDGILKLANAHAYGLLLKKAMMYLPLFPDAWAGATLAVLAVLQIAAGLILLTGIQFRWGLVILLAIAAFHLLGLNWVATKSLLRPGGRFVMRDILLLASVLYFWLAGPGLPVLRVQVSKSAPSSEPPAGMGGTGMPPGMGRL
ncbi:MAG: hypothetical protein AB1439_04605 [candidate division FCPU426 bacterium]